MKSVNQILTAKLGEKWAQSPAVALRVMLAGYLPLVIETIGRGPRGRPAVSVCHYGEQNGDAMRDPEICFELMPDGAWSPYYFRNDYVGFETELFLRRGPILLWRSHAYFELIKFVATWDGNLVEQGFTSDHASVIDCIASEEIRHVEDLGLESVDVATTEDDL